MKNLTTISLFIFGVVVTAILSASLIYYQGNKNKLITTEIKDSATKTSNQDIATTSTNQVVNPSGSSLVLDLKEISKHSSTADCWLLINNKVYNVTPFISSHPGGARTIASSCGKESTQTFNTGENGGPHSDRANAMLTDYYLGDFNQTIK